jgi:hypothetical protein
MRFLSRRAPRVDAETAARRPAAPERATLCASPSWLAWQTLTYGGCTQVKVAGVTYHMNDLRATAHRYGRLVMAELRIEDEGPYAGAVRVHIGGMQLGSVPRGLAPKFREVIHCLNAAEQPATCRAELDAEPGEYVDIWLSAKPEERTPNDPFLPPLLGARLSVPADVVTYLDDVVLGPRAKSKRVLRTAELIQRDNGWIACLDGRMLGALPDTRYPRLEQARAAGFPLTCQVTHPASA